ncbi:YihY/virulence factor BrkB family protein [Aridibaculum aurantiacum]|uniref:YihY/virulence factor BrkB family protein n=1 Tax=Aridibaculum aurantiacum TaxID=2810307 RepID=UPI001A96D4E7|nr:YihY/virulence factor BrkB family protein [Aridibaculum aurantiacum]
MGKRKQKVKTWISLSKEALGVLKENDPLRMAAATAFFTTFALPPILIIMVQVFGLIFNMEHLGDRFFERIAGVLGTESSGQIKRTFLGFKSKAQNWWITIGGFVFLMFVATTLFKVIKDSLNQLWNIRMDTKGKMKANLAKRGVSMVIILLAGILFITNTMAEGVQSLLGDYLNEVSPGAGSLVNRILNKIISVVIVTIWFSILLKLLPDANPTWRVVITGGFVTGILFTIGKAVIPRMLPFGELSSIFGTSASIVLLLLFVFYSSFILYFGACFTRQYALHIEEPIEAGSHAYKYDPEKVKEAQEEKVDEPGETESSKA